MHFVFLNQYYPPDAAPTGVMLQGLVEELLQGGHEVTVLCASGGYAGARGETLRHKTQEGENEENVAAVCDRRSQGEEDGPTAGWVAGPRGSCHAETMGGESGDREETLEAFAGGFFAEHRPCEAGASRSYDGPAETMGGESLDREQTSEAFSGGSFAEHRQCEAGASRSYDGPAETMGGENLDREGTCEAFSGGAFAGHRPCEAGASRSGLRSESPIPNLQSPIPPFRVIRIGATRFGRGSFLGKLLDYVSYYVGVAWRLLVMKQRPDRVVALTTPPFLSVVARLVSKLRGGDHAHWVMDLYPDVMTAHGMLGEKGLGFRVLSGLARWGFGGKRCAAVVTLGPDMAERVGRYVDLEVKWVPLWGDGGTGPRGSCHARTMGGESGDREGTLEAFAGGSFAEHRRGEAGVGPRGSCHAKSMDGESGDRHGTLEAFPGGSFAEHRRCEAGVGPRGSCHARWMGGESLDREGTFGAFEGGSFAEHRRCEAGASRSFGGAAETMGGESGDREGTLEAFAGGSFAEHRPCEAGASRSRIASRSGSSIHDPRSHISSAALRARRGWGDGDLVVMYSGNMGLGHRFGEILAVAERLVNPLSPIPDTLSSSNIRFVFFGGGKRRGEIEEFMRLRPGCGVELHDYVDADWLGVHLGSADVHLVSLDPAWTGMMVPSKLQGIFEVGKPVIFIGSAESSIGTWVKESGAGWVVEPGDVEALEGALEAARDRGLLAEMGRAALEFSRVNFDKRVNLSRVADALVTGRGASIFDGFLPD